MALRFYGRLASLIFPSCSEQRYRTPPQAALRARIEQQPPPTYTEVDPCVANTTPTPTSSGGGPVHRRRRKEG